MITWLLPVKPVRFIRSPQALLLLSHNVYFFFLAESQFLLLPFLCPPTLAQGFGNSHEELQKALGFFSPQSQNLCHKGLK